MTALAPGGSQATIHYTLDLRAGSGLGFEPQIPAALFEPAALVSGPDVVVPEPSTWLMLAIGGGLVALGRGRFPGRAH